MSTPPPEPNQHAELVRALVKAQDLCARLDAERSAAELEASRAECRAEELEQSIAFRLGSLLLGARSFKGLAGLPAGFARLVRHWRERDLRPALDASICAEGGADERALELPGADIARAWHVAQRAERPVSLAGLRIAAIVDEFTEACFAPDCEMLNLSFPDTERELDGFQPHLLFVESAWRGKSAAWMHKVAPCSDALRRLVDACRRRGVPAVFWSKEDPGHFDDFIEAAALFDYVFTTDRDCVARYRERLGHERVEVLGFACQPAIHNPVEEKSRAAAASFAGSWYAKYPRRARDFEALVEAVQAVMPVEIYDRNHARNDPAFAYPHEYRPLLRSGVPYERIAEVYRSCQFAITVNTITDSPTMFARRVFELLACNTVTVSNYSLGLDRTFGDIVVMDRRDDIGSRLARLLESRDARHRLRLRGLREVLRHHTSAMRLAQVAAAVLGPLAMEAPRVWVIAQVGSHDELVRVVDMFRAQRWEEKELLLVGPEGLHGAVELGEGARFVDGGVVTASLVQEPGWLSPWHPADYYGPCYLLDMMHATRYSREQVIGKASFFKASESGIEMESEVAPYRKTGGLLPRCSIIARELVADRAIGEVSDVAAFGLLSDGLAIDEFSYCMGGARTPDASLVDVAD